MAREGGWLTTAFCACFLLVTSIAAHFLPFERSALAPDDYAHLLRVTTTAPIGLADYFVRYPSRPLNQLALDVQSRLVGDRVDLGLFLVVASSSMMLLTVFVALRIVTRDRNTAFLTVLLFSVFPTMVEVYHTPVFVNINVVIALYLSSFLAFDRYLSSGTRIWAFVSLIAYSIGVFWYEIGFFLPLSLLLYQRTRDTHYHTKGIWLLGQSLVAASYATFRLTAAFGLAPADSVARPLNLADFLPGALDLAHHLVGRYLARTVLYGAYLFYGEEGVQVWAAVILLASLSVAATLLARRLPPIRIRRPALLFLAVLGCLFLLPSVLSGAVGGRHLVVPSIAVAAILVRLLLRFGDRWHIAYGLLFACCFSIAHGNARAQVKASRINAGIYRTLREQRSLLSLSERVLFDARSFADAIPFTWVPRDFNVLNTYYGAQALETWGIKSMVALSNHGHPLPVFFGVERPIPEGGRWLEVTVSENAGYRAARRRTILMPCRGTFLLTYAGVFGDGPNLGLRAPATTPAENAFRCPLP